MASILIVDDSSLSRRILSRILQNGGHTVSEAASGMAALEQYFLNKPQVVLLDLTMSDMHGLEVLARLRQLDPHARIIVATADVQRSTREMAMKAGASAFLSKPFEEVTVLTTVSSVLEESA